MKLKYYLRGIGIGIIMTTVILMIASAVHQDQPLTDDEIRARATELGMVMVEDLSASDKLSDNKMSGEQTDVAQHASGPALGGTSSEPDAESVKENTKDEKSEDSNASDDKASDGKASDDKTDTDKAENDKEDADTSDKTGQPQTELIEQVEVTIVGGEYSDVVCKKLKKAGVIDDEEDFNKYLSKKGYDNLIQPGNYVIPLDADYDTIIKLITEKKTKDDKTKKTQKNKN